MYNRKERELALSLYDEFGLTRTVIDILGYPTKSCLRNWINNRDKPFNVKRKPAVHPCLQQKLDAIKRLEAGENQKTIAASLDVTVTTLLNWRREFKEKGIDAIMAKDDITLPSPTPEDLAALPDDVEKLKEMCFELKFENDTMKEVVKILKKDPSVDPINLSNKEKTILIDAMRKTYSLSFLANRLNIALSTYHYNRKALNRPDKYADVRTAIREEFKAAGCTRGYRFIYRMLLNRTDIARIGEKKVRQIMAQEGLVVLYTKRAKRYSSYKGEISNAPTNVVQRDFHANAPNELWLTDITEFKLPDETHKVYLSPIIDCFDGAVISWTAGTSPTAELANTSLKQACLKLKDGQHPVCHSDRGSHYRWDGWIKICNQYGLTRSMSKKGCPPDNAACEGFFGCLKNEFYYSRNWSGVSAEEFIEQLNLWLRYYNEERVKESLGWMSPMEYRKSLGIAA